MIIPDSERKELLAKGDDLQTEKVKTQQISDDFNTTAAHHLRQEEAARILRQTERDIQKLKILETKLKISHVKTKVKIAEQTVTPILSKLNL
jgi:hypothetical protein